jgi:hypothetical protein
MRLPTRADWESVRGFCLKYKGILIVSGLMLLFGSLFFFSKYQDSKVVYQEVNQPDFSGGKILSTGDDIYQKKERVLSEGSYAPAPMQPYALVTPEPTTGPEIISFPVKAKTENAQMSVKLPSESFVKAKLLTGVEAPEGKDCRARHHRSTQLVLQQARRQSRRV